MAHYKWRYKHGVNLGGWLSQCETRADRNHFNGFITQKDIQRIANWGFDHVRLPVDSTVILHQDGSFKQTALGVIDHCLVWCHEANLGLVLDMHRLPGYNIATPMQNDLFVSDRNLSHALSIWTMFSNRYLHIGDELRFEILNEPEWQSSYPVNCFYAKLIAKIHSIDPLRSMIVGGNHYYHVDALESIQQYHYLNVIYSYHYYEPNLFTNQLHDVNHDIAGAYPEPVHYPGNFPNLQAYLSKHPDRAKEFRKYCWTLNDRKLMERYMAKAIDFQKYTYKDLYLGEFGVCYYADSKSRCSWIADVTALAEEHQIGWCYWTYKEMDYGLVNIEGEVIDQNVLATLRAWCARK